MKKRYGDPKKNTVAQSPEALKAVGDRAVQVNPVNRPASMEVSLLKNSFVEMYKSTATPHYVAVRICLALIFTYLFSF